jgi:hypothetical protein
LRLKNYSCVQYGKLQKMESRCEISYFMGKIFLKRYENSLTLHSPKKAGCRFGNPLIEATEAISVDLRPKLPCAVAPEKLLLVRKGRNGDSGVLG